jgi:hypothetical protein
MPNERKISCPACHYELSGLLEERCPECGGHFDRELLLRLHAAAWPASRAAPLTVVAALSLLLLPYSLPTAIQTLPSIWLYTALAFRLPDWTFFGFIVACSIAFVLWNHQLLRGRPQIPRRTVVLLAVLQLLNWPWIICSASFWGYLGMSYVLRVSVVNLVLLTTLVTGWCAAKKHPHFLLTLAFHWIAWIWLTAYFFPYFGELP